MSTSQPGILLPIPGHARYLEFGIIPDADPVPVLRELAARPVGPELVIGLGPGMIQGLGETIDGIRPFPAISGPGCVVPSTQGDLWCWVRGEDRGEVLHAARAIAEYSFGRIGVYTAKRARKHIVCIMIPGLLVRMTATIVRSWKSWMFAPPSSSRKHEKQVAT